MVAKFSHVSSAHDAQVHIYVSCVLFFTLSDIVLCSHCFSELYLFMWHENNNFISHEKGRVYIHLRSGSQQYDP